MRERLGTMPAEFSQRQQARLYSIGSHALDLAALRYGTGFPEFAPGARMDLPFNNSRHDFLVGENAAIMAGAQGLSPSWQELSRTIGNAHDVVNEQERGKDERESAEWLEVRLLETNLFDRIVCRIGARAILGTQPVYLSGDTKGNLIGQMAAHMEFESEIEEKIVKGVACADHGELHTPSGPLMGHYLLRQREGLGPHEQPDMKVLAAFQAKEATFVDEYRYLLPEAEKVLATHRKEVVAYAYFLAQAIERGDIHSVGQVEALDLAFQRNPTARSDELLKVA